ncbi:MAG: hypothetical protein C0592_10710 [Marinilabiliales bacterium]|nr:MAG: hypothetical protein C0592_10710 [Marinilabiliales bacterium]
MELSGKIVQVLDIVTGEGKNGQWKKQDFILELPGQYQKKVCITIFGDKVEQFNVQVGQEVKVDVDVASREYNGKWFTNVNAWKIETQGSEGADPIPNYDIAQEGPEAQGLEPSDDLPF